jgi:hypothetical protein
MDSNSIKVASATIEGYTTKIKIGDWSRPRTLGVNGICICVQITANCYDCSTCQKRIETVEALLKKKKIEHLWHGGWLILSNKSSHTWTLSVQEGKQWNATDPLGYLSKLLERECVEIVSTEQKPA